LKKTIPLFRSLIFAQTRILRFTAFLQIKNKYSQLF